MTMNGKHTIAEIHDLCATIEFRIKAVQSLIAKVNTAPGAFLNPGVPFVSAGTINEWNTWQNRWRSASDSVLPLCTALSISNPLTPASVMTAEDQWRKLINAITAKSCDENTKFCDVGPFKPGDMTFQLQKVENEAKQRIDETNHPQPTADDPDLKQFLALDKAIKEGEKAAAAAKEQTKQAAFRVPWWAWVGGVVVVGGVATAYVAPIANLFPRRR